MAKTYELVEAAGREGIKCLLCHRTSYRPEDVWNLWCGACNIFHEFVATIEMTGDDAFPVDLTKGCPDCGTKAFRRGPSGGACTNVECTTCKAKFNVIRRVGWAHRIDGREPHGTLWGNEEDATQ